MNGTVQSLLNNINHAKRLYNNPIIFEPKGVYIGKRHLLYLLIIFMISHVMKDYFH